MKEVPGSSPNNEEQQDWYERRFGVRYHIVQDRPFTVDEHGKPAPRASRVERRRNRFSPNREAR